MDSKTNCHTTDRHFLQQLLILSYMTAAACAVNARNVCTGTRVQTDKCIRSEKCSHHATTCTTHDIDIPTTDNTNKTKRRAANTPHRRAYTKIYNLTLLTCLLMYYKRFGCGWGATMNANIHIPNGYQTIFKY